MYVLYVGYYSPPGLCRILDSDTIGPTDLFYPSPAPPFSVFHIFVRGYVVVLFVETLRCKPEGSIPNGVFRIFH